MSRPALVVADRWRLLPYASRRSVATVCAPTSRSHARKHAGRRPVRAHQEEDMKFARMFVFVGLLVAVSAAGVTHASAQMRQLAGGYLAGSFPMGDWGKIAGFGMALDGTDVVRKPGKALAMRSSLSLLYNFSRTVDVP